MCRKQEKYKMLLLRKINKYIYKAEITLFAGILLSILLLGLLQIVLRNFFSYSLVWIDKFSMSSVLWLTFIGASISTYRLEHIKLDLFKNLSSKYIKIISISLSILILSCFIYASFEFLVFEYEGGVISFLNVPSFIVFIIVPFSLIIILLRSFNIKGYKK